MFIFRIYCLFVFTSICNFDANCQKLFDVLRNSSSTGQLYCIGDVIKHELQYDESKYKIDSIIWVFSLCSSPFCATQIDSFKVFKTFNENFQNIVFTYDTPPFSGNALNISVYYKEDGKNKLYKDSRLYTTTYCNIDRPNFLSDKKSICVGDCINFADISDRSPTWRSWIFEGSDTKYSRDSSPVDICYSAPGLYDVTLFVGNPVDTDTVVLKNYIEVKPKGNLISPEFTTLTAVVGDTISLEACTEGNQYLWTPKFGIECDTCNLTSLIVTGNVKYSAVVTSDNYCPVECFVDVKISIEDLIYVPNVFSPNGDGVNDDLQPSYNKDIQIRKFSIYSRWGDLLFTSSEIPYSWDGTLNGSNLNPGVYVWFVKYYNSKTKKNDLIKGSTTLVR